VLDLAEEGFVAGTGVIKLFEQLGGSFGFEVLEGEVFELAANFTHAQAMGDGRINLNEVQEKAPSFFKGKAEGAAA
jgi:hypothetical protein